MKRLLVVHPFLFAIFPSLFLFANNVGQMSFAQTWGSLLISLGFSCLLFVALKLVLKNGRKAGVIVSVLYILFFSYGHVYNLLWGGQAGRILAALRLDDIPASARHTVLLIVWAFLFLAISTLVLKTKRGLHDLTRYLNAVSLALVVMSLVNIGFHEVRTALALRGRERAENTAIAAAKGGRPDELPDIYYIILDGYASAEILQDLYGYDNGEFLDTLSEKGFFVAEQSRANYAQTNLSLASSLNLDYLDDLAGRMGAKSQDREPLEEMIHDNAVFRFLRQQGYAIVTFASSYGSTDVKEADIYLSPGWSWDEFEVALLNTTPLPVVLKGWVRYNPYEMHRSKIRYALDHLGDVPGGQAPRFVFAHIVAPHPPFVFGQGGEPVDPDDEFTLADGSHYFETASRDQYLKQYVDQLIFINGEVEAALDKILLQASRPTIIILQADHGPGSMLDWKSAEKTNLKERLSIFNAYWLPLEDRTGLYAEITPVNTFRWIFRRFFGADYPPLPDKSYFSTWKRPYDFIDVTQEIGSPETTP